MDVITIRIDEKREIELLPPSTSLPERPLIILAHGAGNNMHSQFMQLISEYLEEYKINVLRFNFSYKVYGKKIPDTQSVLEQAWLSAVDWTGNNLKYSGLFIGGKSLGARIASIISSRLKNLLGLVFLGYPLHLPGKLENLRDKHLYDLNLPMLFLQGTRDPFAKLELLEKVIRKLEPFSHLFLLEQADHSYKMPKKLDRTYENILKEAADITARWILQIWENK